MKEEESGEVIRTYMMGINEIVKYSIFVLFEFVSRYYDFPIYNDMLLMSLVTNIYNQLLTIICKYHSLIITKK